MSVFDELYTTEIFNFIAASTNRKISQNPAKSLDLVDMTEVNRSSAETFATDLDKKP